MNNQTHRYLVTRVLRDEHMGKKMKGIKRYRFMVINTS